MPLVITSVRLAVRALQRNRLRTGLTMVGLGNGAQRTVEQDVRSSGTNLVHVRAGNFTRGGEDSNIPSGLGSATTLVPADADAIEREVAGVQHLTPTVK